MSDIPVSSRVVGHKRWQGQGCRGPVQRPRGSPDPPVPIQPPPRQPRPTQYTAKVEEDLEIPEGQHPEGQHPEAPVQPHRVLRYAEAVEFGRFRDIQLLRHRSFDWDLLGSLGQVDRIRQLLTDRWTTALACDSIQYDELTREFYAKFRHRSGDFDQPDAVSFALGRETFEMSVPQFAVAIGFYTEDEVQLPAFKESIRGIVTRPRDFWILDGVLAEFWGTIGDGPHSSSVVESSIRDPVHRYIHRIVACTLLGRHSGHEKCSNADLFCLYSIIGRHEANIATILLSSLIRASRVVAASSNLPLGPYITRLAERLGVFDHYQPGDFTAGPATGFFGIEDARKAGMCTYTDPPAWVDVRRGPQAPPPPGTEAAGASQMGLLSHRQRLVVPHIERPQQQHPRRQPPPPQPQSVTLDMIYQCQVAMREEIRAHLTRHDDYFRVLLTHLQVPIPESLRLPEEHTGDDAGPSGADEEHMEE